MFFQMMQPNLLGSVFQAVFETESMKIGSRNDLVLTDLGCKTNIILQCLIRTLTNK